MMHIPSTNLPLEELYSRRKRHLKLFGTFVYSLIYTTLFLSNKRAQDNVKAQDNRKNAVHIIFRGFK